MRILIITPYYTPDLGPSAPMFEMLCKALINIGHKVTIISMVPHYPTGRVLAGYSAWKMRKTCEDGVEVIRIPIPSMNRQSLVQRMLQFLIFQIGATIAGLIQNIDAVLISNPFICSLMPLFWQTIIRRKPTIYSVFDVYPEVGIKLGIFRNRVALFFAEHLERFCLEHSSIVHILTKSFKPELISMGVPDRKMTLIYPWVDTKLITPLPRHNSFSNKYGLDDYFVVMYAGNIGHSQGLEYLLAAAEILGDQEDIRFVYVGDGSGKEFLRQETEKKQLGNVKFIELQPRENLPEVLASADISVVLLKQGIGVASIPSKIFSIMASGRPILASVDAESETCSLIREAGVGVIAPPEEPAKLAETILALKQDETMRIELGKNGRSWVEKHHSAQSAAEQFERALLEAVEMKK